eukprot:TRINITY_DN21914_c0_g1_i3.p1 TRINITY_DN21914_c0_g1~~TRINITY_DN21914_c0_g1_i3.p1  ORF type:complete len:166 (+),score=18.27 TRINITY_DN21914_c0_g1_i3:248-745(+)
MRFFGLCLALAQKSFQPTCIWTFERVALETFDRHLRLEATVRYQEGEASGLWKCDKTEFWCVTSRIQAKALEENAQGIATVKGSFRCRVVLCVHRRLEEDSFGEYFPPSSALEFELRIRRNEDIDLLGSDLFKVMRCTSRDLQSALARVSCLQQKGSRLTFTHSF